MIFFIIGLGECQGVPLRNYAPLPSYNRVTKNVPFRRGEFTPEFQISTKIVDYTDRYRIDGIDTDSSVRSACSPR